MLYAVVAFHDDHSGARILGLFDNQAQADQVLGVAAALGTHETLTVVQGRPGQLLDREAGDCFKVRAPSA